MCSLCIPYAAYASNLALVAPGHHAIAGPPRCTKTPGLWMVTHVTLNPYRNRDDLDSHPYKKW